MEKRLHPRRRLQTVPWNVHGLHSAFAVAAFLLLPGTAAANMGTPLMWAGGLHLLFGNAIIGIIEGAILMRLWRVKRAWAVSLMVLGNYVAWWGGVAASTAFRGVVDWALGAVPLLHIHRAIALTMGAAFLGSVQSA